jgi:MoaA/NifB/PqqE/SkfB family radical SAM enzyme
VCPSRDQLSAGPRTVSIALTNKCDLDCPFCYAPKEPSTLEAERVFEWCRVLDGIGTLDIAFGGGEPTLYPGLADLCHRIWNETHLGVSITSHGHHLNPQFVDRLVGGISVIRLSIDAPEPTYSRIRRRNLEHLAQHVRYLRRKIPFGINVVVNVLTLPHLDEMLSLAANWGACDLLLLPEVHRGRFVLKPREWKALEDWINRRWHKFPMQLTSAARGFLDCPFLAQQGEDLGYVHIGADSRLRLSSYEGGGILVSDGDSLLRAIAWIRVATGRSLI